MEKRTHRKKIAHPRKDIYTLDLFDSNKLREGVRQSNLSIKSGGGGYLDVYSVLKLSPLIQFDDIRLDDLRKIGLHKTWQNIARAIGMDNFLTMWRMLSEEEHFIGKNSHQDGRISVGLRNYSAYRRFNRDKLILKMHRAGLTVSEIQKKLAKVYKFHVQYSQISNVINRKQDIL